MNRNVLFAIALGVLTVLWMLTGLFGADASKDEEKEEISMFTVEVRSINAENYAQPVFIRARTEAEKRVMIAAETDGLIVDIPVTEGASVKKGDVLCRIADENRSAMLEQAQTGLEKAQLDYDGALRLKDGGFQSRSQIAGTKANLKIAESNVQRAEMDVERLLVKAPFNGVLENKSAEVGSFIQRGMPCAELVALDPIIIAGHVTEDAMINLSVGDIATVSFLGAEQAQSAMVRYVAKTSDANTHSYRVEIALENLNNRIVAGQTASAVVAGKAVRAHRVSSSLLTLLDNGEIGLRTLNKNDLVEVHRVEILGDSKQGIWVSGLPAEARLIVVGQEYVAEGQQVKVVDTSSTLEVNTSGQN